jgi:PAS domain S-box-containing protein
MEKSGASPEKPGASPEKPEASPLATLLIIDADGGKAAELAAALGVLNLDILIASSAEAGFKRLEPLPYAVVLLDLDLPGAGLEAARAIRKCNSSKCMPILFTSRKTLADGDLSQLFSLRTVDFTRYPVPAEVIRTKVRMLLELCQAYQTAWDLSERRSVEAAGLRRVRELEALNDISKVLEQNLDLETVLQAAMGKVLDTFGCDRAYLARPYFPDENSLSVPFIAARPGLPGPKSGAVQPMLEFSRHIFPEVLKNPEPGIYREPQGVPGFAAFSKAFGVQSMMVIDLKAGLGGTWVLGMQQCGFAREWTAEEQALFKEVAFRISGALNNLLFHRNLRNSEERFRQLAESLPQIIWTASPEGDNEYLNRRWFEYTGMEAAPFARNTVLTAIHPKDLDRVLAEWGERILAGRPYQAEFRLRKADGSYRWHLSMVEPVRDGEGKIWKWVGSFTDVDAQKRNEAEIRKSRTKMEIILEGIGDAIFVLDPKGEVEYLNPAAATLLGYASPGEVHELAQSPEADAARLALSLSDEEGNPIPMDKTPAGMALQGIEVPPVLIRYRKNKDAPEKWIISRARPIKDENGAIQFVVAIVQDVTDIRNSESELRQSQKMEAIGRLAGGIAHDFNNLLTAINGYSEVGLGMTGEDNPLHPVLKEILDAGMRAASLTNQLLAHSRKQILMPKILDLNGTLRNMQSMLTRIIGEDMDLAMLLHDDGSLIKADPGQIEQVILNLAVNARDAMPTGGKVTLESKVVHIDKGHVDVGEAIPPGRYFRLCVSDTGHGMSKSVRDHIFEPFYTTKPINKGTGLGLSTVYGIVKQSGGYISVYSEPHFGATFKIYFPLVGDVGDAGDPGNGPLELPREMPSIPSMGETILLVEDEGVVRKLTETILTGLDYRVLAASSAEIALDMARAHQGGIDLLLTDVVMSGMGGQDLILELRKSRPGIPVLYMSGYTDDAIVRHGVLESTANFIQKPFSPRILSEKVREALAPAGRVEAIAQEFQGR